MFAAVFDKSAEGLLKVIEMPKPQLRQDNAIVKVLAVGVCGSDLLKLDRDLVPEGTVLGHEMVGSIAEISPELAQRYDLHVGDRIVSSHHVPCKQCVYCLRGQESLCEQFKTTNFKPGAFAEFLELSEGHLQHTVRKIPDQLSNLEASFVEPLACCLKAIRRAGLSEQHRNFARQPLSTQLIIGLGSMGLLLGQALKQLSPSSLVHGIDLLEPRVKLALDLGFDLASSKLADDALYDYIFLAAGASASIPLAMQHARAGATIVVFSSSKETSSFDNNQIYYRELTITSSYSPNLEDLDLSLELLSKSRVKVRELISRTSKLHDLGACLKAAQQEQAIKVCLEF